jgi:hypothetical protein
LLRKHFLKPTHHLGVEIIFLTEVRCQPTWTLALVNLQLLSFSGSDVDIDQQQGHSVLVLIPALLGNSVVL